MQGDALFPADENPLLSDPPWAWERLVEAMGPASLLVVIESRMSSALERRMRPEDILQEALLQAWKDREHFQWRGLKAFRSWFLSVIDNRIRDAADREGAKKRGGDRQVAVLSALEGQDAAASEESGFLGPVASTTPSRVAIHREQADVMRAALEKLPADVREVVRLRLFEECSTEEVARRLELGLSAVKHRFRKGSGLYHRLLEDELATRSRSRGPDS